MTDTQWPRFLVFEQANAKRPHIIAGSVHAPDAEMAMLNARDVFVRRPEVISLWVAPADAVFAITVEQLTLDPTWAERVPPAEGDEETYLVFHKQSHKGRHAHVGEVQAADALNAMRRALAAFPDADPIVHWVLPERLAYRSTEEDLDIMFAQLQRKPFRSQSSFLVQARMRAIKDEFREEDYG